MSGGDMRSARPQQPSPYSDTIMLSRLMHAARSVWELRRPDGSLYLRRHVLEGDDCLDTHEGARLNVFVHEIAAPDSDRHAHNHPWAWATACVLRGGYTEQRDGVLWERRAGDAPELLTPDVYHRIARVQPGTVTLFVTGREIDDWGFLVDGVHVPHRAYLGRTGVDAMTLTRVR